MVSEDEVLSWLGLTKTNPIHLSRTELTMIVSKVEEQARASERERLLPLVKRAALWFIKPSSRKEAEQDIEKVFRTEKNED